MRIAMIGTRGVPAKYGGFETAVEEVGRRLVDLGHEVTVYCRRAPDGTVAPKEYLGMRTVTLPAVRSKTLETISHTALSCLHAAITQRQDAVVLFNAANSVLLPLLRLRRLPTAVHVDGLEWKRSKWNGTAQRYYRWAEALSVRWADALIADADGIADYYATEFSASTALIAYGAPILDELGTDGLEPFGVAPGEYHLVVARFEPENHVELIVEGYRRSNARHPLLLVGSSPYGDEYIERVHAAAADDPRIVFLGPIWDQDQLDQLYQHALTYLHGHSVGGTNPSLLRAMGAGTAVTAFDVVFNREVAGPDAAFFHDPASVAEAVEAAEVDPTSATRAGAALQRRARARYDWDQVARAYQGLLIQIARGGGRRGEVSGRRSGDTVEQIGRAA